MKAIFSSLVVSVLLVIYVWLIWRGLNVIACIEDSGCAALSQTDFNDRMASSLALVNGLVSALVVSELAVTEPGKVPLAPFATQEMIQKIGKPVKLLAGLYLIVWLVAGLAAFFLGYLFADPDSLPPLSAIGQAWLGVAVGAAYAYFQINKKE